MYPQKREHHRHTVNASNTCFTLAKEQVPQSQFLPEPWRKQLLEENPCHANFSTV